MPVARGREGGREGKGGGGVRRGAMVWEWGGGGGTD